MGVDNIAGPLRRQILEAAGDGSMASMTVLAVGNDPYRIDTPAGHRDGAWFRDQFDAALALKGRQKIHLRDLHYATFTRGVLKPNGAPYTNTDPDWNWIQDKAADAGRWLGYVPFDKVIDNRNPDPHIRPVVRLAEPRKSFLYEPIVDIKIDFDLLTTLNDFAARQPYRLVLFGEKSSLYDDLRPFSDRFETDLFTPIGEISDTQIHLMAAAGALDGRPMRVFTISDFDPAGYQMPISIARKLQAFKTLKFPSLEFEVLPIALTVEQVRAMDLPSTPLKETERRADAWREAWGVEQTEIDALATVKPREFKRIVAEAIKPYFDATLSQRTQTAKFEWTQRADEAVAEQVGTKIKSLEQEAEEVVRLAQDKLDAIAERVREIVDSADINLPEIPEIPQPVIDTSLHGKPIISTSWTWEEQTRRLIERKNYESPPPISSGGRLDDPMTRAA